MEFLCSQCRNTLRVPDEIAGRKAQCPNCGAIQIVPARMGISAFSEPGSPSHTPSIPEEVLSSIPPVENHEVPEGFQSSSPDDFSSYSPNLFQEPVQDFQESGNPFQSPARFERIPPLPAPRTESLIPTKITFSELFRNTWDVFFGRFTEFLMLGLLSILAGLLVQVLQITMQLITRGTDHDVFVFIIFLISFFFGLVINSIFWVGLIRCSLRLARGGEQDYSLLFKDFHQAVNAILSNIVLGIAYLLLSAFAVVVFFAISHFFDPLNDELSFLIIIVVVSCVFAFFLIILMIRLFFFATFIVDRDQGPVQSIQSSLQFTSGNTATLFRAFFVYGFLSLFVMLFTCGLGAILVPPFFCCFTTVGYLMITGQPVFNRSRQFLPSKGQEFPSEW